MASIKPRPYAPDVAIPPGTTILEMLVDKGMSQTELAVRMNRPANKINEILQGKRAITVETAEALEYVLGLPAYFWLKLEQNYQLAQKRIESETRLQEEAEKLKHFPLKEMARLGWIDTLKDPLKQAHSLLSFFGVASLSQLSKPHVHQPAFRRSDFKDACPYATAAWLRKGELEAAKIEVADFDARALKASQNRLRSLSLLLPNQSRSQLVDICATHGVAVVFVPHLPKSYASGAAYWVGDRAVIQLSFRFLTDDHFWFSFFHELGHILLHGKKETFIDNFNGDKNNKEAEANSYASRVLISDAHYERLKGLRPYNERTITAFAKEISIAPGVVVGRLQHDKLISYKSALNSLKIRISSNH